MKLSKELSEDIAKFIIENPEMAQDLINVANITNVKVTEEE